VSETNPDRLRHVFATPFGFPPDSDTPPICGADLTSAYHCCYGYCPMCMAILRMWEEAGQPAVQPFLRSLATTH